jgi:cytidylate kinase
MTKLVVAIDGTAGSGKSTLGKRLAKHFNLRYIDSGAMYRSVGWKALVAGIDLRDTDALARLAREAKIEQYDRPEGQLVLVDGRDVTEEIRTPEASVAASAVAIVPGVRKAVSELLRKMGADCGIVVEGRDMGTVVFPDADVKFFLDASLSIRAQRRLAQQEDQGIAQEIEAVENDISRRDERDSTRETAPLTVAPDAIVVDTTDRTLDDLEAQLTAIIDERLNT